MPDCHLSINRESLIEFRSVTISRPVSRSYDRASTPGYRDPGAFLRTYPATGARDADCSSKSGLAQIGAQIAHSASQSFAQQRSQGGSINITYFGCDGFNVEVATVQQGPRAFDAKILKIRKRRFAKHRFATTLQCARDSVASALAASCNENPSFRWSRDHRSKR